MTGGDKEEDLMMDGEISDDDVKEDEEDDE